MRDFLHPSRPGLGSTQSSKPLVLAVFPGGKVAGAIHLLPSTPPMVVVYEGGVQPPPPEIPKFCQSWAEFPVPWNIHLWQPNQNMGFIQLQIEWNPWRGVYRSQIPALSVLYPQLNLLNPLPPLSEKNSLVRHCPMACSLPVLWWTLSLLY
jgi:hypothetical protein